MVDVVKSPVEQLYDHALSLMDSSDGEYYHRVSDPRWGAVQWSADLEVTGFVEYLDSVVLRDRRSFGAGKCEPVCKQHSQLLCCLEMAMALEHGEVDPFFEALKSLVKLDEARVDLVRGIRRVKPCEFSDLSVLGSELAGYVEAVSDSAELIMLLKCRFDTAGSPMTWLIEQSFVSMARSLAEYYDQLSALSGSKQVDGGESAVVSEPVE